MPPKTRGSKTLKISKENVGNTVKGKLKAPDVRKKSQRKVLADKTNSASDDNVNSTLLKKVKTYDLEKTDLKKPRRERKVPSRYLESPALVNLSKRNNEQNSPTLTPVKSKVKKKLHTKIAAQQKSPPKTTSKRLENSILKSRPKRVCRIPSKLEGHSVSPNKYIPLQPVSTSTPVANKTVRNKNHALLKTPSPVLSDVSKQPLPKRNKKKNAAVAADTNNNGKKQQQIDKCFEKQIQSGKSRKTPLNCSYRVLDDNKRSLKRNSVKPDPYEFTFDPDEEPPQKKKKKRVAKPRQPKPKAPIKGAYEKNLAKALATLKNTMAKKTQSAKDVQVIDKVNAPIAINVEDANNKNDANLKSQVNEINNSIPCANNYNSVRIEDIAMDLQDPDHTLDYSPVNSPHHSVPKVPTKDLLATEKDPLNLRDDLSFFDDQPVASSSMNASIRHPTASPWRVEFGSLPIKWPVNTYVKPNMTPAVESSFINFNDSKKKHVYTNIVPINNALPQETSLKQTSIISFIKEVAERSAKKKKKSTPVKSNSLFEDITNTSINMISTKSASKNNSKDSNSGHVDVIIGNVDNSITKTPEKSNSTKCATFFGFDETEEENQENVSPLKKDKRRALKPRSKVVLQEINNLKGPSRAVIPISVKSKPILNSDHLNNEFEDPKSGLEPPQFPDKETLPNNGETTNLNVLDDDSNSVHLFEDMDLIHHYHQPPRKSYGKAKKVTFRQNSATDSDATNDEEQVSDEEDNLDDLSFKLPSFKAKRVHKKKLTKKQKISKKEEQEAETWAAGFNSMCDDIEEFDLIVE